MLIPGIELRENNGRYFLRNPAVGIQLELNRLGYRIIERLTQGAEFSEVFTEINKESLLISEDLDEFIETLDRLCFFSHRNNKDHQNWTVEWDITYRCNLRCRHCMVEGGEPLDDELTTEEAFTLLNQLKEERFKILVISGGEPLVREDFPKILTYAHSKGFFVKLLTNACLITSEIASLLARQGVIFTQISLDGPDAESYESIRGKGSFNDMLCGVENLREAGVNFGMTMVLTAENHLLLEDTLRLAIECGASAFAAGPLVETGRAVVNTLSPPPEGNDMSLELECLSLSKKYSSQISFNSYLVSVAARKELEGKGYHTSACSRIAQGIAVYPNGMVSFCKGFFGKCDLSKVPIKEGFVLGRFPEMPLVSILERRSAYDFDVSANSVDCQGCSVRTLCKGGCPAEVFIKYGDFRLPVGACTLKQKYLKLEKIMAAP